MTTITSYAEALAYLAKGRNKSNRPAPSGNARRIVRDFVAPGTVSVVYHRTPVVTYWADGTVKLYAGGWATRTTLDVMSTYASRAAGLRASVRNRDKHGRGDGFLFSGREDDWPREPARVRKCRTCKGTGIGHEKWDVPGERYPCYRCKGAGMCDYGSAIVPLELTDDDCLEILPDGTMTADELASFPDYDCRCKMCAGGFSSWQEMHWATVAGNYAPSSPAAPAYAHSGDTLATVLPGLDTRVPCPALCGATETIRDTVIRLNDSHRWTREQIADWLDTLDADLTFPTPATSNAV